MSKKICLIFVIIICKYTYSSAQIPGMDKQKIAIGTDTVDLILAYELCNYKDQLCMCYDGIEQYYRAPQFISLDSGNFMSSYNRNIYTMSIPYMASYRSRDSLQAYHTNSQYFDSLITESNVVSFYNNQYHKGVTDRLKELTQYFRKTNPQYPELKFDGRFYYALFRIKFTTMYLGEFDIFLPNIEGNLDDFKKSKFYINHKSKKYYYIDEILYIKPVVVY